MLSDSLKVFITVADKKNFSKAAKALNLTQPAISFQIQTLEQYYQTKLFDRINRHVKLTETGELLLEYALSMNDLQSELERKMQQLTGHVKGQLMIGASRTVEYVLPYVICKFKEDYPDVDVTLEIYNTKHVEEKVMGRYLDIGLVEGAPVDKDLESIPFLDDELVVITSVDHPWSKLESISIFELDQYPYISREKGSGTRAEIEQHLKAAGFSPNNLNVMMRLGSTNAIKSAVRNGYGFTIVSRWAIKDDLKMGNLAMVKIKEDEFKRRFRIVYHKKKFKTQAAEEFLKFIESETFQ